MQRQQPIPNYIYHKKNVSSRIKKIKREIKPNECPLCGKAMGATCNSHSVPQMVLKSISTNSHLYNKNKIDELLFFDSETGINNTGTFQFICRTCDNTFFSDYENPDTIHNRPSTKALIEISAKNILQKMQAKRFEAVFFSKDPQMLLLDIRDRKETVETFELGYRDYSNYLEQLKQFKESETENLFKICYFNVLPYVVPVASQECFTIYRDLHGNKINDPKLGANDAIQLIHLCIFPCNGKTTVLMYYYNEHNSYDTLAEQLSSLSETEQLQMINYYLFAFGENYYFSEDIKKEILESPQMKKISKEYIGERGDFGVMQHGHTPHYTPVKYDEIPFILGPDLAIG